MNRSVLPRIDGSNPQAVCGSANLRTPGGLAKPPGAPGTRPAPPQRPAMMVTVEVAPMESVLVQVSPTLCAVDGTQLAGVPAGGAGLV